MIGRFGCFAKFASSIVASRPRLQILPAYSWVVAPIATWFGPASRSTASIRRRARGPHLPRMALATRLQGGVGLGSNCGSGQSVIRTGVQPRASRGNSGSAIMARRETSFVCQNWGAGYSRWQGKCDACGEWNTIAEESSASPQRRMPRKGRRFALEQLAGADHEAPGLASGLAEFDRVTGGGFVRGSVLLLGGDPGIGKSTLLI